MAVSNYVSEKKSTRVYDLAEELGLEGGEVLDYSIIKGDVVNDSALMEHFTTLFSKYAGEDSEIIYIFGNANEITVYAYGQEDESTLEVTLGGGNSELPITARIKEEVPFQKQESKIIVSSNGEEYEFDLNPGQNFYFIIKKEGVVATN